MKSILITGGCGFIGTNFILALAQKEAKCRIINLDKLTYAGNPENLTQLEGDSRYEFVQGDICDRDLVFTLFEKYDIGSVVHFAAESHVDRSIIASEEFIQTNVVGTFALLEAAKNYWAEGEGCFVHVSTDEVYGSLGDTGFFQETTAYAPSSPYSASKASSDHLASAYFHTYGLPVIITNCSNNYGPYQFPEKLIPLVILNALSGKEIPVYGDGLNVRDWLYVEDHVEALMRVLSDGQPGHTYNIGGNNERTNLDVVTSICNLLDEFAHPLTSGQARKELIRFVADRPGHDRRYAIDSTKIKTELGWTPSVDFLAGIKKTVQWYMENPSWTAAVMDGTCRENYLQVFKGR